MRERLQEITRRYGKIRTIRRASLYYFHVEIADVPAATERPTLRLVVCRELPATTPSTTPTLKETSHGHH